MQKAVTYFEFEGLKLPIQELTGKFFQDDKLFIKDSLNPRIVKALMANVIENIPSMLVGPTGAGKTATVKWLASTTRNGYRRFQLTGSTDVDTLVGRQLLNEKGTYWVDGILTECLRNGYWLLLDEINMALPEVVAVVNSVLDDDAVLVLADNNNEIIEKHPNFRLFACMNPSDDYSGTKDMNKATLDRFSVLEFEYPDNASEIAIIEKHSGLKRDAGGIPKLKRKPIVERMIDFAHTTRKKRRDADFISSVSTRQLIQWAKLLKYVDIKHAADISIINKAEQSDRKFLIDELNTFFKDGETFESNIEEQKKVAAREKNKVKEGDMTFVPHIIRDDALATDIKWDIADEELEASKNAIILGKNTVA